MEMAAQRWQGDGGAQVMSHTTAPSSHKPSVSLYQISAFIDKTIYATSGHGVLASRGKQGRKTHAHISWLAHSLFPVDPDDVSPGAVHRTGELAAQADGVDAACV